MRTDQTRGEMAALFDLPFSEHPFRVVEANRWDDAAGKVQLRTLFLDQSRRLRHEMLLLLAEHSARERSAGRRIDGRKCGAEFSACRESGGSAAFSAWARRGGRRAEANVGSARSGLA